MNRADFLKKAYDRRHAMLADLSVTRSCAETARRYEVSRQRAHALIKQARREVEAQEEKETKQ